MLPIKKIVCPVDYSEFSLTALDTAAELCGKLDADLAVLHVVTPIPKAQGTPTATSFDIPKYEKHLIKQSREKLQQLVDERVPGTVTAESAVVQGLEADSIVNFTENNDGDLIVIATHGRTGLKHFLLGSVTEKVLRHTSKAVLTIHPDRE